MQMTRVKEKFKDFWLEEVDLIKLKISVCPAKKNLFLGEQIPPMEYFSNLNHDERTTKFFMVYFKFKSFFLQL